MSQKDRDLIVSEKHRLGLSVANSNVYINHLQGKIDEAVAKDFIAEIYALKDAKKPIDISKLNPNSIAKCLKNCNDLKLSFKSYAKEVHLVCFGNELSTIIGYKGWIKLLKRSGGDIKVHPLFSTDKFEYHIDMNSMSDIIKIHDVKVEARHLNDSKWVHENIRGVAVTIFHKDFISEKVMFVDYQTLQKRRDKSATVKGSAYGNFWGEWATEMYKKTAIIYAINECNIDIGDASLALATDIDKEQYSNDDKDIPNINQTVNGIKIEEEDIF